MASTQAASEKWLRGKVKAVPSGDCLVIMGSTKAEIPPEKTITLSSIIAPRLVCHSKCKFIHKQNTFDDFSGKIFVVLLLALVSLNLFFFSCLLVLTSYIT